MSLPQIPPRRGDNPRHVYFTYVGCDRGYTFEAWTAGPTMWFAMHPSTKSKPCLEEMTSGKLACPFCRAGKLAMVKGYVPLYRSADAKPVMVVVDEAVRDKVDRIDTFTRVKVGREKSRGSTVWVTPLILQEPHWQSTLPERQRAADLTFTLLRMWQIPELQDWYNKQPRLHSDTAVSLPTGTAVTDKGEPYTSMLQAAAKRAGAVVKPPEAAVDNAETTRELLRAIQEGKSPHTNGNGRKKKPQED